MIVAWHEVLGLRHPEKSRPVGRGMIRAGVRADFEGWRRKFRDTVSASRIEMLPKCIGGFLDHVRHLVILLPVESASPDHTEPYGTVPLGDAFPGISCLATINLSLRDKAIGRSKGIPLS